jgi:hypothetical protein
MSTTVNVTSENYPVTIDVEDVTINVTVDGSGALLAVNNLSDVANAATARMNLGVDSSAEVDAKIEATGGGAVPPSVITHISRTDNPHNVQENQIPDGIDYTLLFENALL